MAISDIIRKGAITILIVSVVFLTFLSILSIWNLVGSDVLGKSFTTVCVIGFAALIVVVAGNAWEGHVAGKQGGQNQSFPPRQ